MEEKPEEPKEGRTAPAATRHGEHEHHARPAIGGNVLTAVRAHPLFVEAALVAFILLFAAALFYWQDLQGKVYIEKSQISAPIISLGPAAPGTLERLYVGEGDMVSQGQRLALVGNQTITASTHGMVVGVLNAPGQYVTPQTAVVRMIDPDEFRVVGRIQEDKGLEYIIPGQHVMFTVDAFGPKQYSGTVESVGMTSRDSDIVFSISDKREPKEFEVRVLFDNNAYPELKNGMSAKMWIYK
jgi:multidrug resistance efflux pump